MNITERFREGFKLAAKREANDTKCNILAILWVLADDQQRQSILEAYKKEYEHDPENVQEIEDRVSEIREIRADTQRLRRETASLKLDTIGAYVQIATLTAEKYAVLTARAIQDTIDEIFGPRR